MKFQNVDSQRRLIAIGRIKRWVQPGEVVDLSSIDLRTIGPNRSKIRSVSEDTPLGLPVVEKKVVEAPKKKETLVEKVIKKVTKKKVEPTAAELKEQRAELKAALEDMNKGELYAFVEDNMDIDLKYKDKKDVFVKKGLAAAKKIGYKKILRKI